MRVFAAECYFAWYLVDSLHNAVNVSLRNNRGSILLLAKKQIQVTICRKKFDA